MRATLPVQKFKDFMKQWFHSQTYLSKNLNPMENPAIVYLYLYLAISDKEFSESELQLILEKLKHNPAFQGMDISKFIGEVHQNFLQLPFDSVLIYLENYMSEINLSEAERTHIIKDLEDIMEADGVVKKEEMMAFQRIRKYLTPPISNQGFRASA